METAVREVREETGVDCEITDVLAAQVKTIEHRDEPQSYPMLTVEFLARGDGTVSVADDEEILEARWFVEPPAEGVSEFLEAAVVEQTTSE